MSENFNWGIGAGAPPTIYNNGGLPTPTDRIPARAPQQAAPGSNYVGDGATDPDTNARNFGTPSRISVSPESLQMYTNAGAAYDPLGTKSMRDASAAGVSQIQSMYPRGTYPEAPSPKDMPKALAAESQQRFGQGDRSRLQNPDGGFGTFMTGREGAMPDSSGGGFVRGNTAYNVNDTSQQGVQRVTARGTSPLYTNIKPEDAVAGLRNQTIGQPADQEAQGLARMQRANDIRGEMIANRDKDIPAGGYGPGILQDPNESLNAERTQRWAQDDLMRYAKNNPEMRGIVQELFRNDAARDVNANNVAGRMNELGMQGRNQLAAYGLQGQNQLANTALGESLRGRSQQTMEDRRFDRESGLLDRRIAAEAPSRNAQAGWYGAQTRKTEDDAALGKTEYGMITKLATDIMKAEGGDYDTAMAKAAKTVLGANRAATRLKEGKAAGGVVGYEGGGQVQPADRAEELLARMNAKYGAAAGSAPAPAPVPQPAPVPPPVQQQPQGFFGRAKQAIGGYGTPDPNRMPVEARAYGGEVGGEVGDPQAHSAGLAAIDAGKARDGQVASQFSSIYQNLGFAFGGAVPAQDIPGGRAVAQAVAGRQVFGQSDGSGHDDALPAVIDGERPAALTSGEFVWPVNAVKFYGMDRLNKMLAAAEKGMAAHGDTA